MQLHTEVIQPHREVSSSPRNLNLRSKPLKWALHPRDRWRRPWKIMAMCPLIAVSLSKSAAKSSANGCSFSYKGSLPDRETPVPMVHLWQSQSHECTGNSGTCTSISHHHRRSILVNTPTGFVGFLHRSHVHTLLPYALKGASSLRAEKFQMFSQNSAVTNSVLFHGLGNPVAHNVHDSQDHKALISHLLLLQHICHLQPTVCESLPPSGVRSNLRSSVWKE